MSLVNAASGDLPLDLAVPAEPGRQRSLLVATGLAAAGSAVAIITLLGIYLAARHGALLSAGGEWLPAGSLPLTAPTMALFTMALSVPVMQWAVYAIGNDDRQSTWVAMGLVLLLGVAYINAESFIWNGLGLGIHDSNAALLLFAATGAHVAMVVVGMLFILLMGFRTLGGQYHSRDREGVAAAALFWYVSVALFGVLWYAIYVTK